MSADPSRRKLARLPEGAAERLRAAYFDGDVTSVAAMARAHGVSRATVQRFARAQGWPARRRLPRRPKEVAPLVIEPAKPREAAAWPDRDYTLADAAAALRRQASVQIASLREALETGIADPEKAARALASLARTLKTAQSLESTGSAAPDAAVADEPDPRSLAELRDELAARLDRIAEDERAYAVPRGPDETGAEAPA